MKYKFIKNIKTFSKTTLPIWINVSQSLGSLPITASHLGAGLHAAGLSAAISSAAAAGLVGENVTFLIVHLTFYHNSPETNKIITQNNLYDLLTQQT